MPVDYSSLPPGYAGVGAGLEDGANKSLVTISRHNKWGYLVLVGPNGQEHTIGLVDTFTMTESNNSELLDTAGSDWLELEIGARRWNGSLTRKHVRGADLKLLMRRIYPNAKDVDFRYMPFIIKYKFDYKPPIGLIKSYEVAEWVYHKIIIVRYTNNPITAPNKLLSESADFIGAGEGYSQAGVDVYSSNEIVWAGETYLLPVATTGAVNPVAGGAGGIVNQFGNPNVGNQNIGGGGNAQLGAG